MKDNLKVKDVVIDPLQWEAQQVEAGFKDIQDAMRLGIIASYSVKTTYTPQQLAVRTYVFTVYDEHLTKLQEAEAKGMMGRTDEDV